MVLMKSYRPWHPDQSFLFPPSPRDWLPDDHLAYFVLDLVAGLDLSKIEGVIHAKDARGTRPFDPRMMTALILYGYSVGVVSSRRIERATYEDVAFRVLAGDQHPDHSAISAFRKRHLKALGSLFVQVLRLCQEAGLVKLGHVALDGTKIKANASKRKAMSYKRILKTEKALAAEVEAMLREANATDDAEDELHGTDRRGDELPEELRRRKGRLKKLAQARRALEAGAAKAYAKKSRARAQAKAKKVKDSKPSPSDKAVGDAEIARYEAEYDTAIAIGAAEHEVEAMQREVEEFAKVVQDPASKSRLTRARQRKQRALQGLAQTREELSASPSDESAHELPKHRTPITALGQPTAKAQQNFTDPDSRILKAGDGFIQGFNCQAAVDEAHQVIVAAAASNQAPDVEYLKPMLDEVAANCGATPEVFTADAGYWSDDNARFCEVLGVDAYIATGRENAASKKSGGSRSRPKQSELKRAMARKLKTESGKAKYARRKAVGEPPFGQIKEARGLRRFLLRGMEQVAEEWNLMCLTHNLLKLFRAQGVAKQAPA